MEDLKTVEARIAREAKEYVQLVDEFETELNDRKRHWQTRRAQHRKEAKAREMRRYQITALVIAVLAVLLTKFVLF